MSSSAIKISAIVGLFVIVIAVAIAATAAKSDTQTASQTPSMATTDATPPDNSSSASTNPNATYKDGTYKGTGTYNTPESTETVFVTMTIKDGLVTAVDTTSTENEHESRFYHQQFLDNYKAQVVGKSLATLSLSHVAASSLTPIGFNAALDQIRSQAQA